MTVSGDLKENAIEFYKGDKRATGSFSQEKYIKRMKELAKEYPEECQIVAENDDGSIYCHFPTKWIKISANKREVTEEQRAAARERLMKYRAESGK